MDRTETQNMITEGTDVYGSDGEKVGSVVAVQPSYLVVEKGFFFPTDYYIPSSAIARAGEDGVFLNVSKDAALNQGWDVEPTGDVMVTDSMSTVETSDVVRSDAGMVNDRVGAATTQVADSDSLRVAVHEEELTASKTQREMGKVRIQKDVIAEERTISVPVTEERVRVERHVVDRPVGADDHAFQEGVIEVPVMGEEVHLGKQVRVSEEIEIGKEAVQRTEQATGTVRREEVRVDETDVTRGSNVQVDETDVTRGSKVR